MPSLLLAASNLVSVCAHPQTDHLIGTRTTRGNMYRATLLLGLCALAGAQSCPEYIDYSKERHEPFSSGKYKLSYQRPAPECRKFVLPEVEQAIVDMKTTIADPDLFRLFENAFPNTLDTTISWHGYANGTDEEVRQRPGLGDVVI